MKQMGIQDINSAISPDVVDAIARGVGMNSEEMALTLKRIQFMNKRESYIAEFDNKLAMIELSLKVYEMETCFWGVESVKNFP